MLAGRRWSQPEFVGLGPCRLLLDGDVVGLALEGVVLAGGEDCDPLRAGGQGEGGIEERGVRVVAGELLILFRAVDPEFRAMHERHAGGGETEDCLAAGVAGGCAEMDAGGRGGKRASAKPR